MRGDRGISREMPFLYCGCDGFVRAVISPGRGPTRTPGEGSSDSRHRVGNDSLGSPVDSYGKAENSVCNMLDPLIVLTVINCLFMFSSTLTTCALWWQYRSNHSCCKKKAAYVVRNPKPAKTKRNFPASKKADKSELDTLFTVIWPDKLSTIVDNETHSKRCEKKKSTTKLKSLSQFSQHVDPGTVANFERAENPEENGRFTNPIKPGFIMAFSIWSMQPQQTLSFRDISPRKYMQEHCGVRRLRM